MTVEEVIAVDDDDDVRMTQYDPDSQFDDERAWMMMQDSQPPNLSPPPESPNELEDVVEATAPTLEGKGGGGVNGDKPPEDDLEAGHICTDVFHTLVYEKHLFFSRWQIMVIPHDDRLLQGTYMYTCMHMYVHVLS